MFEPYKLITVALAVLLLAPFSYVLWQIATHRPRPNVQVKAELEASLREELPKRGGGTYTANPDGSVTETGVGMLGQVEGIAFSESTMSWLSFFPRPWVGVLGLLGVACILA